MVKILKKHQSRHTTPSNVSQNRLNSIQNSIKFYSYILNWKYLYTGIDFYIY